MYGIALSVSACLRAGTRVDIAWLVGRDGEPAVDPTEAVALTPGGGRVGSLLSGALDGQLGELAATHGRQGRLRRIRVGPADAALSGIPAGREVACMLVPAVELPDELWPRLLARESVCLVMDLDDDSVTAASVFTADSTHDTSDDVRAVMAAGKSIATIVGNRVITVLQPTPTLVIVGGGDIAEATGAIAHVVGWQVATAETEDDAAGLIAGLSELDAVVVLGHDLEMGGRALMTSLAGTVGYIGSVGSMKLQQSRSDWLAYRDVTDLARVHGPAGLDIGARSPQEVGVAIVAEIIAMRTVEPG